MKATVIVKTVRISYDLTEQEYGCWGRGLHPAPVIFQPEVNSARNKAPSGNRAWALLPQTSTLVGFRVDSWSAPSAWGHGCALVDSSELRASSESIAQAVLV